MQAASAVQPLAGWYSSHWGIPPENLGRRPFLVVTGQQLQQPLAALQDLYQRAIFLLGAARRLSAVPAPPDHPLSSENQPTVFSAETPLPGDKTAAPLPLAGPQPLRSSPRPSGPLTKAAQEPGSPAVSADPSPWVFSGAAAVNEPSQVVVSPETLEALQGEGEVLLQAVRDLGAALTTHKSLAPELRDYGAALMDKFAQSLAPLGILQPGEPLTLDQERWAKAWQDKPEKVAEALWGPRSLTPELTSLAAAIAGAPGVYLLQSSYQAPETYQPFQSPHPWFRIAPVYFYMVA